MLTVPFVDISRAISGLTAVGPTAQCRPTASVSSAHDPGRAPRRQQCSDRWPFRPFQDT